MELWIRNIWWILTGVTGGLSFILLIIYLCLYYIKIKPFKKFMKREGPDKPKDDHLRPSIGVFSSFHSAKVPVETVELQPGPCLAKVTSEPSSPVITTAHIIIEEDKVTPEEAVVQMVEVPHSTHVDFY